MLSYQELALFERIKRIRRCGLIGGIVALGVGVGWRWSFEVSKAHARPSLSHLLPLDQDVEFLLLLQRHVCLCATMLPP